MAKNDLTIIISKKKQKKCTDLFDFNKFDELGLITVQDASSIQIVSSRSESLYKGYVIVSREEYESLILLPEMYPSSTIDFLNARKNEVDIYNFLFTGVFGKAFVGEMLKYIKDNMSVDDIWVLEDRLNVIHPFLLFCQVEMRNLF